MADDESFPCYWQHQLQITDEQVDPRLTFDFTRWIMVTGVPDTLPPEQVLNELLLPPLEHRRCVPDPRSPHHYRLVLVCQDVDEAIALCNRLYGSEFMGASLVAVLVSELIDEIEDMEIQLSQDSPNLKQDAAIAIPEVILNFAFPEHLMHRLCSVYGKIKTLRSVVTAEYACIPTIVVTYGFLSEAYSAEIALNGSPFEDSILKVNLITNLERREALLVQLVRGDFFSSNPQQELMEEVEFSASPAGISGWPSVLTSEDASGSVRRDVV